MVVTVVVPSFNEAGNVEPLVRALGEALSGVDADVLYVDDSTDGTADVVAAIRGDAPLPLDVYHRERALGGLSGAVVEGLRRARGSVVVVMDGDLQHPPAVIPAMLELLDAGAEIAIASRYVGGGDAGGLSSSRPPAGLLVGDRAEPGGPAARARGLHRPDDRVLRGPCRPDRPRAARPLGLQDPAGGARHARPEGRRGALHVRAASRGGVEGDDAPGPAVPAPARVACADGPGAVLRRGSWLRTRRPTVRRPRPRADGRPAAGRFSCGRSASRLGCTRLGSPGILGYSGG